MSWSAWVPWLRRKHPLGSPAARQVPTVPPTTVFTVGIVRGQVTPDPKEPALSAATPGEWLHEDQRGSRAWWQVSSESLGICPYVCPDHNRHCDAYGDGRTANLFHTDPHACSLCDHWTPRPGDQL